MTFWHWVQHHVTTGNVAFVLTLILGGPGGWYREVAIVEVENPGRTAVTCSDIGLDLGRVHWWQRWRHTVTPSYLPYNDAKTEGTVRLEPFDRAFFIIDIWQVLQPVNHHSFKLQDRPIKLRGSGARQIVGSQDHLVDGAARLAPAWLCAACPGGLSCGGVTRPCGAGRRVCGLVAARAAWPGPLPAKARQLR
jgi:hypothetical protein